MISLFCGVVVDVVFVDVELKFPKATVIRATKTYVSNLSRNIAAKLVEKRCCALYIPHTTCLATKTKRVASSCSALQKVEVHSTFSNKIPKMLPVLPLQGNLFRNKITFLALLICQEWRLRLSIRFLCQVATTIFVFIDQLSLRDLVADQSEA